MSKERIGIIGGSGLYEFLEDPEHLEVTTPYGSTSAPLALGRLEGREVLFLPRHGTNHQYPPHKVPYKANMWALKEAGATRILAPCASGSLDRELPAGTLVVPDQLVDQTRGRDQTFYDHGAVHVPFAEPYCHGGRTKALTAARQVGWEAQDGGTMVVVQGPRFSTRAESQSYARSGFQLVNMTGHPEAVLAREKALCYTSVALVTDLDAGISGERGVTQEEVFNEFARNTQRLKDVLREMVRTWDDDPDCDCRRALEGTKEATER